MQFYALVEEWPDKSIIFFRALPGCFSSASTTAKALQQAPEAIADYFRWLKENEIVLVEEEITPIEVVLQERLACSKGDPGPLFEADRAAPNDLEIDNALNVAATARALLMEFISEMPSTLYDTPPMQGGWSLTEHLQHIMEVEAWYMRHLQEQLPEVGSIEVLTADEASMQMFENAIDHEILLRELTPEQRAHAFVHGSETWTAAKVLRRLVHHLREHYAWMQEIVQQFSTVK
jgi:uncharacterized damage-inducible protein DinB/predicted RNase H-like HicB family nuclease